MGRGGVNGRRVVREKENERKNGGKRKGGGEGARGVVTSKYKYCSCSSLPSDIIIII